MHDQGEDGSNDEGEDESDSAFDTDAVNKLFEGSSSDE